MDATHPPEGFRYLGEKETMIRGDSYYAVHDKQFVPIPIKIIGRMAGPICVVIRKIKR